MSLNKLLIVLGLVTALAVPAGIWAYKVHNSPGGWSAAWNQHVRNTTGAKLGRPAKAGPGAERTMFNEIEDPNLGAQAVKGVKDYADAVEGSKKGKDRKPDFKAARDETKRAYGEKPDFSIKK